MDVQRNTRRSKRVKTKIRVHCKTEGVFFSDFTRDICVDGIGIESTATIMEGTIVEMHLMIPGEAEPLVTKGKVIWSNVIEQPVSKSSSVAIGIKFEEMGVAHREKLLHFIENHDIKKA